MERTLVFHFGKLNKVDKKILNKEEINWRVPTEERRYKIKLERFGIIYVDHETYKDYMREPWNDWKEKILGNRCRIKSEKGNFYKRCNENCLG